MFVTMVMQKHCQLRIQIISIFFSFDYNTGCPQDTLFMWTETDLGFLRESKYAVSSQNVAFFRVVLLGWF